jgi:hypothetical protein
MRRNRSCFIFAVLMLSVLSLTCDGTATPVAPPNPYEQYIKEIVPESWNKVDPQQVAARREWAVFYQVGDPSVVPVDGVMYRLIVDVHPKLSDKTPSFTAYDLPSPYDGHACESRCRAERGDLLSMYAEEGGDGSELLIWDQKEEDTTRLLAYQWVSDTLEYRLLAHFDGDRIEWEQDQVTVDRYTPEKAELALRCTYTPLDGAQIFNASQSHSRSEYVFPEDMPDVPDRVLTSPHPEMVAVALCSQMHYTDTARIQPYFTEEAWEAAAQGQGGWRWCAVTSSPLIHVRVTRVEIVENRHLLDCDSQGSDGAPGDRAVVTAGIICEYEDASNNAELSVLCNMVREEGGWRFAGPCSVEGT